MATTEAQVQAVTSPKEKNKAHKLSKDAQKLMDLIPSAKKIQIDLDDLFIDETMNMRGEDAYDQASIESMAEQIRATGGLLQSPGVAEIDAEEREDYEGKLYVPIWGWRRILALQMLSHEDPKWGSGVDVVSVATGDSQSAFHFLQLIENEAREDVNDLDRANTIEAILSDPESTLKQGDVAKMLNMSDSTVSQLRKLLKMPKLGQNLLKEEKISRSHCRTLFQHVPENHWETALKMAARYSYGEFETQVKRLYGKKPEDGEGEESSSDSSSGNSSREPAMIPKKSLEKYFLPFINDRLAKADDKKKTFTAQDIEKARLDALKTVLKKESELSSSIKSYIEKIDKKEAAAKEREDDKKRADKYISKACRAAKKLAVESPSKTLAECLAVVAKEALALPKEQFEENGLHFYLDQDKEKREQNVESLADLLTKENEDQLEVQHKREEARKKKEEEKKAKEAEEAKEGAAEGAEDSEAAEGTAAEGES